MVQPAPGAGTPQNPDQPNEATNEERIKALETQVAEATKKMNESNERAAQAENLLNVYTTVYGEERPSSPTPPPPVSNTPAPANEQRDVWLKKIQENPEQAFQEFGERIKNDIRKEYSREQYNNRIREFFYTQNPDLKDHADLVGVISRKVESMNPGKPINEQLKLTADEVRKYIGKIREGNQSSGEHVDVLEGGSAQIPPAPKPDEKKLSPQEEIQKEISEHNKSRYNKVI